MNDGPTAAAWPKADRLFRRDPAWLGGDDAQSVAVHGDRRLWFFGDSFVRETDGTGRHDAWFVHNSVGVQHGRDPATARMDFFWDHGHDGIPAPVFVDPDPDVWLWPGGALAHRDRLVLFFMRMAARGQESAPDLPPYDVRGWSVALVEDPGDDPRSWRVDWPIVPRTPFAMLVGNGGVFVHDGYLYAHGIRDLHTRLDRADADPVRSGAMLTRWPVGAFLDGDLGHMTWRDGGSWVPNAELSAPPRPTLGPTETEFSVHVAEDGTFWAVMITDIHRGEIVVRHARRPEGPWSEPVVVHVAEQACDDPADKRVAYAAKAHPGTTGDPSALLVTYASNHFSLDVLRDRMELYWPHALRLDLPLAPEVGPSRGNLAR